MMRKKIKMKMWKKITDFIANNPNFKQKLVDLSSDANLSLTYEKGAGKIEIKQVLKTMKAVIRILRSLSILKIVIS